jgi:hypothetical protein
VKKKRFTEQQIIAVFEGSRSRDAGEGAVPQARIQ